jgi:hypothetical protein
MSFVQATGEVFIPQKRISSTLKIEISSLLWVIFALLDPDAADKMKANPDPQHWSVPSSANFSALTLAIIELLSPDGL